MKKIKKEIKKNIQNTKKPHPFIHIQLFLVQIIILVCEQKKTRKID